MRLDKAAADLFVLSRTEAREAIKSGSVTVNGEICADPRADVSTRDEIGMEGKTATTAFIYLMMNKPAGVLSVSRDDRQQTVIDILPEQYKRKGLMSVGRLDKDTTGMLIITDDGAFAHRITSPKSGVYKRYAVQYEGQTHANAVGLFRLGVTLEDGSVCLPARIFLLPGGRAEVIIQEGKYHQIKRMFAAIGCTVTALSRMSTGLLNLDTALKSGEVRPISSEEIDLIFKEI